MGNTMMFPATWEEYLKDYEFKDSEEVYTNGSMLIQSFRVRQMMEHYSQPMKHGWWKTYRNFTLFANTFVCSECNYNYTSSGGNVNYCPNCGAKMDGEV